MKHYTGNGRRCVCIIKSHANESEQNEHKKRERKIKCIARLKDILQLYPNRTSTLICHTNLQTAAATAAVLQQRIHARKMSLDGVCSSLSMILFGGMHMVSERQQITPIHPKQKKNRKQKQIVDMFLSNNRTDCAKRNAQYFLLLLMLMVVAIFLHSNFNLIVNTCLSY